MLHIVILNKGYFPDKLKSQNASKDRVIVIASEADSIPVSAYRNVLLKNMEVKLLPTIKDTTSSEGKSQLRIAQAMLIGQLTTSEKEYEIYTDDNTLLAALSPFTGKKVASKKAPKNTAPKKELKAEEGPIPVVPEKTSAPRTRAKKETDSKKAPGRKIKEKEAAPKKEAFTSRVKSEVKTPSKPTKSPDKNPAVKLPTLAQVKTVIGAANSVHAKTLLNTLKKSNQVTFEMNARMELAKAGLDAGACQELAKMVNEEFGKTLPIA